MRHAHGARIGVLLLGLLSIAATMLATALPTPTAIQFARGKSSALVEGGVARGELAYYRFGARTGQRAEVKVAAPEDNAVFQLYPPGWKLVEEDGMVSVQGTALPGAGEGEDATRWAGELPKSGDYLLVVGASRGGAAFTLELTIR